MRSFLSCTLLVAAAAALSTANAAAVLDERSQCVAEICGESSFSQLLERQDLPAVAPLPSPTVATPVAVVEKELTNAERLAKGLPLKPPTRRSKKGSSLLSFLFFYRSLTFLAAVIFGDVDHPLAHAARSNPSPVPTITYLGYIDVRSGPDSVGYITNAGTAASVGHYMTTTDQSQALLVSISLPVGAVSASNVDISIPVCRSLLYPLMEDCILIFPPITSPWVVSYWDGLKVEMIPLPTWLRVPTSQHFFPNKMKFHTDTPLAISTSLESPLPAVSPLFQSSMKIELTSATPSDS